MEILLHGFGPYQWNQDGSIYTIGTIINRDIVMERLGNAHSFEAFAECVKEITGSFAVIVDRKDCLWAAVDNARSFPLFFSDDGSVISDRAQAIIAHNNETGKMVTLDDVALAEMVASRNTKYEDTVYKEIKQCDLGAAYCFGCSVSRTYYYRHFAEKENHLDSETLDSRLEKILDTIFDEYLTTLKDKQIVVPLSGGYDSRLLLSALFRKKVPNVVCYTYGRESDYDVKTSKQVADTLGYEWHFVPYETADWNAFWDDNNSEREAYFEYTHNHCNMPHIQDFIALKKLRTQGIIQSGAVVLPGFCADLPAGSFIKDHLKESYTKDELVEEIFCECFVNVELNPQYSKAIKERIHSSLSAICKRDTLSQSEYAHLFICWFTADRPAKWVVNSVRVYEYFGLEWRLPFWDKRFLDFFYRLEVSRLQRCQYYTDFIFNTYFLPFGIGIRKPNASHVAVQCRESKLKKGIKSFVRKRLIDVSYATGIFVYNRNGTNNYNVACRCIYKKLKKYHFTHGKYGGVHQLEMIWWCIRQYGISAVSPMICTKGDTEK